MQSIVQFLINAIEGTPGALAMVVFGILAILALCIYLPFKIATDEKCLFESRAFNVCYGLLAVFLPLLSFIYIFFNWKPVVRGVAASIVFLTLSASVFILRSLTSVFFVAT